MSVGITIKWNYSARVLSHYPLKVFWGVWIDSFDIKPGFTLVPKLRSFNIYFSRVNSLISSYNIYDNKFVLNIVTILFCYGIGEATAIVLPLTAAPLYVGFSSVYGKLYQMKFLFSRWECCRKDWNGDADAASQVVCYRRNEN